MGFFKRLRAKTRSRGGKRDLYGEQDQEQYQPYAQYQQQPGGSFGRRPARDYTKTLPPNVLSNIFYQVCPHARDTSLTSSEESMTEDGCMLCDMRDLAHAALVCTHWYGIAQNILYQHIRIDAVHYCELEVELAAKRKKNSFLNHNAEPLDAPRTRLLLFMRTVRDSRALGSMVKSLRMPYMTREASKSELARTISVLPNLRYVDLPAGFFSDDASSMTLKQELLARCPDIRRMKFAKGSESSFSRLPKVKGWPNLEVLELSGLNIETNLLRMILGYFERLTDLRFEDMPWLEDTVFKAVPTLPPFPALQRLTLTDTPKITSRGLAWYLSSSSQTRSCLRHLSMVNTGVEPQRLHEVLAQAPLLSSLSMQQEVTREFPPDYVPPLTSNSLQLLHYEITSETGSSSFGAQALSTSYYTYLMSSLLTGSLPNLTDLYVRDANFPETLMLAPPPPVFGDPSRQSQANVGLNQALAVYSKGMDELEWNFTTYQPFAEAGRRMSTTRPVSLHGAQLSPAWGGEARRSVLVGNGFGGFLAVPAEEERRPSTSTRSSGGRREKRDLWR
ncbi:F-box domain-containing protein [Trichophyton equinum CBS 127.97]|uniref:F-box domain-containing protein n=1 Tax=Trichophyton equinum (strain ATCC MYA-4606 / CBS 127.97) TaxID=559882 RepID=F2PRU4_TRIEC|nr:F-box domain-containing protein [Trichophyton equinum CBS 127.97]